MSYNVKKITILRDFTTFYLHHTFLTEESFDLPYVAGDYQEIIPDDIIKSGKVKKIDSPLFNKANMLRIAEKADPNSILFLELDRNHWLNSIISNSEQIVTDLYYTEPDRLLYSFFNVSESVPTALILQKENDQGMACQKIKLNASDPLFRQFFIRKAKKEINIAGPLPELLTQAEAAQYLQVKLKTIQNWTSENKIPVEYAVGTPRYRKATLDKWLKGEKI